MGRDKENLRKWKEANRERIRAQDRERDKLTYIQKREIILEKNRKWRERHSEQIRERLLKTRDERLRRRRESYAKRGKAVNQEYYQTHKEQYASHLRRYRKSNPDRYRLYWNIRRAKSGEPLSETQWAAIKKAYDYKCAYCGDKSKVLTQDHIVPVSKGGLTEIGNIVPACRICNSRKSSSEPKSPLKILML